MLAKCIPWNRQYCSALYQLAFDCIKVINVRSKPQATLFFTYLEKDTEVVLFGSQFLQWHCPSAIGIFAAFVHTIGAC